MSISGHLGKVADAPGISAEIPLTRGMVALVDAADLQLVAAHRWSLLPKRTGLGWYAKTTPPGNRKGTLLLHRLILAGIPRVDHKNGDGLDCRRENLRSATGTENNANSVKRRGTSSSSFKGVSWEMGRWKARIACARRTIYLGSFADEADAASAYNAAALEVFGEFARLNDVDAIAKAEARS